jgi:hypothetical protein
VKLLALGAHSSRPSDRSTPPLAGTAGRSGTILETGAKTHQKTRARSAYSLIRRPAFSSESVASLEWTAGEKRFAQDASLRRTRTTTEGGHP